MVILLCIIVIIIHSRTPFIVSSGGPWSIGYGSSSEPLVSLNVLDSKSIYSFKDLQKIEKETSFLADPFFIKEKDTFYLFFELQKTKPNAEIALMTSANGVEYEYKGVVLKEDFHLSYPQVFKHQDDFFMIPETKRAGAILLYKSTNFPYKWQIEDTLVSNVRLKDPSVYLSDSLNLLVASDDKLNMHMYVADSLKGKWKPYKRKIIKRGTEARAGGRFFVDAQGKLMLPIQNSFKGYGYGLSFYHFKFTGNELKLIRALPFFLKADDSISFFNAGMHHIDIQNVDNSKYYVFDGNMKLDKNKNINIWGPVKWSFIDLLDWFERR